MDGRVEMLLGALREVAIWHHERNPLYRARCEHSAFDPSRHLEQPDDVERLPYVSVEVVRRFGLATHAAEMPWADVPTGTGRTLPTDAETEARTWAMLAALMEHEGLVSARAVHHVLFAPPPGTGPRPAGERFLSMLAEFAPPGAVTYGLRESRNGLSIDDAAVAEALRRSSISGEPVRLIGFPALVARIARALETWPVKLGPGSLVLTSGGWEGPWVPRSRVEFRALVERSLGVPAGRVLDIYRLGEHAASFVECPDHRFHAPVFSRVRAVDPVTLMPLSEGQPGVLALLGPGSTAMPVHALVTTDVGRMVECPCGRGAPAFEVLGRGGRGPHRGFVERVLELIDR